MSVTEHRLNCLDRFVKVQGCGWQLRKPPAAPCAVRYIGETPESGWSFFLMPKDPTKGHPGWYAGMQREFASTMAAEMTGTLDECTRWLEARCNEKGIVSEQVTYLQEYFTVGQTGWQLAEKEPGTWVAWRSIDVLDQAYNLIVRPGRYHYGTEWMAECRDAEGNVIAEMKGRGSEVAAEIHALQRTLGLLATLRECRSMAAAADLLERLQRAQLETLGAALGLPSGNEVFLRRRIAQRALPGRFDPALISSGRW